MLERMETKSCRACSSAKRKCSRQIPRCVRCRRRGVECQYPASKPSSFVLLEEEDASTPERQVARYSSTRFIPTSCIFTEGADPKPDPFNLTVTIWPGPSTDSVFASSWFTNPSTWQIVSWPRTHLLRSGNSRHLRQHMAPIYLWFEQWLHTGSSPFVHQELYRYRLPRCTQDALSTISVYTQRTPARTPFILQLIESRATQLLADYNVVALDHSSSARSIKLLPLSINPDIDTHEHLSRVHALAVYQLLSLFSPSPDLRCRGEARIPILADWMQQLLARCRSHHPTSEDSLYPPTQESGRSSGQAQNQLWHTWIQAESARRAFIIGTTIHSLYMLLRDGIGSAASARNHLVPGGCIGAMPFTTRKGPWQASSHAKWEQLAVDVDFGLRHLDQTLMREVLKGDTKESELDIFAKVFLAGTFGKLKRR